MDTNASLQDVAVLGAAGKMGSGIALLLLQQMTYLQMKEPSNVHFLRLIDVNEAGFLHLRNYLEDQLLKYAEKNIILLRDAVVNNKSLTSNKDVIDFFIDSARNIITFSTNLKSLKETNLIFEAIIEDVELKVETIKKIVDFGNTKGYFFTNTSSIPIHIIENDAGIKNRLIGYHFYNPPVIQKLLEIVIPKDCSKELIDIAKDLANRFKKITVIAEDVAGFIGNGHMIREMVFANNKVKELQKTYTLEQSIYIVNTITEKKLLRPMGIFQLMDYIGLDVCLHITHVMKSYLKDTSLEMELVDILLSIGIKGGQTGDSVQKPGFFEYEKNQISKMYFFDEKRYVKLEDISWKKEIDEKITLANQLTFKTLLKDPNKNSQIQNYLRNIYKDKSFENDLTKEFIDNSYKVSLKLVEDKVSNDLNDVDKVLLNGFYHLYGNQLIKESSV